MDIYYRANTYWRYNATIVTQVLDEAKTRQYVRMLKAPPDFNLSAKFLRELF
jgi:hypothetical protein